MFSSTGTIWLSGRITGGHLLTLAWHTLSVRGIAACLSKGGWRCARHSGYGAGSGFIWKTMFLFTLFGLVPAAIVGWLFGGRWRLRLGTIASFVLAMLAGFLPHGIGRLVDPHDAYPSQFVATFEGRAIHEHGRLLALACLPRLIAGTELDEFERAAVREQSIVVNVLAALIDGRRSREVPPIGEWLAFLCLVGFFAGTLRLALDPIWTADPARKAISVGTLLSALLIVIAFLFNRNIFNSDNYRYLIFLLTPWSLGFGLTLRGLTEGRLFRRVTAAILVMMLIGWMTTTTVAWYRDRLGYLKGVWQVIRVPQMAWSEVPEFDPRKRSPVACVVSTGATHVFGDYWDVYRMAFLSKGAVAGIPYPNYPNRFRGWSQGLGLDEGKLIVLGLRRGSSTVHSRGGVPVGVLRPGGLVRSSALQWRSPFRVVWQNDGRDPAELDRIRFEVPRPTAVGSSHVQ